MDIRDAQFSDVLPLAEMLHRRSKSKTSSHLCRSRIDQFIKRARVPKKHFVRALVAHDGDTLRGFLYAEERQLFDLCPDIRVVEVAFLFGGHGAAVPLLQNLRKQTVKRILIEANAWLGRPGALKRLIHRLGPREFAVIYEL